MRFVLYALVLLVTTTSVLAQNSATWEVWRDADLFKLSSHSTDSATYTLIGTELKLRFNLREPFDGRPTRQLQITIPNFDGARQYNPTTGVTTSWENFSSAKKCNCFDHLVNNVTITRYDSAKSEIAGTFQFKCVSAVAGEEINYRIRNGTFEIGGPKIVLERDPPDSTITVGEIQDDTTIIMTITAKQNGTPVEGVRIFIRDSLATPTLFFEDLGLTNSNGRVAYPIVVRKNAPSALYPIRIYGEKSGSRQSDTTKFNVAYGRRYYYYKCAGVDVLEFDAGEGKEWKPETAGSAVLKTEGGTVTVGGVIKIDGQVRINTTAGQNRVFVDGGRVYIPNVTWAPGDVGDLELDNILTGSDFPLPDCQGIIRLVVNQSDELKALRKKMPGAVGLELESFSFINRPDGKGLAIKGKVKFGNAKEGCDQTIDTTGGFSVTLDPLIGLSMGVQFTDTRGWENFTLDVSNLAFGKALCLSQLSVSADFVNQIYAASGSASWPMAGGKFAVGLGGVLKNNPATPEDDLSVDSATFTLSPGPCRPIGNTPLCFKTFKASASGLSNPTWNGSAWRAGVVLNTLEQVLLDRYPRIAAALGSPALAEIELTGEYRHPANFTGNITGRFFKVTKVSEIRPWQMEGSFIGNIDAYNSAGVSGPHKVGHLGLDDYVLNVNGSMRLFWNPSVSATANVTGTLRIPAAGPELLATPFIGSTLQFMQLSGFIPQTLGTASASITMTEGDGLVLRSTVDVSQNPIDFIKSFGRMDVEYKISDDISLSVRRANVTSWVQPVDDPGVDEDVQDAAQPWRTITVDNTIERLFVMISGANATAAPSSTLTAPDGTVHTTSSVDGKVLRFATPNSEMVQWSLIEPAVGDWTLTLDSPKAGDEVEVTANRKETPFAIAQTTSGRDVTVTWDATTAISGDMINLYIDVDSANYDGLLATTVPLTLGTFTFTIPNELLACTYYVHATRLAEGKPLVFTYAPTAARIPGSSGVPSPVEVTAISNQFGRTSVQWRMPIGTSVSGFQIYVRDASGRDSLYHTASTSERFALINIENHDTKTVYIQTFDSLGIPGCPTDAMSITTGIEDFTYASTGISQIEYSIVPNPTSGHTVIRFNVGATPVHIESIDIVNTMGERVATLSPTGQSSASTSVTSGWTQVQWDAYTHPAGTYYVRIITPHGVSAAPVAIIR